MFEMVNLRCPWDDDVHGFLSGLVSSHRRETTRWEAIDPSRPNIPKFFLDMEVNALRPPGDYPLTFHIYARIRSEAGQARTVFNLHGSKLRVSTRSLIYSACSVLSTIGAFTAHIYEKSNLATQLIAVFAVTGTSITEQHQCQKFTAPANRCRPGWDYHYDTLAARRALPRILGWKSSGPPSLSVENTTENLTRVARPPGHASIFLPHCHWDWDGMSSPEVISEDVSSIPMSQSIVPSSIEYGLGSGAGRCFMGLGELIEGGMNAVLIRRKLSSIKSQLRSGNCSSVANDERSCQHLLELSRRGLYSAKVKREAWSMLFLLISEGETDGLLSAVVKWREIEVQLFIQDAVKHMPADWIFDPLSHGRSSERLHKTFPQLQDNSKLAMGLLQLLSNLMKNGHLVRTDNKRNAKRDSPAFSLSSFVSASGKMVLGPLAFQYTFKVHIGDHALPDVVKSIVCGRLNTIATRLRVEVASYEPSKEITGLFSELLLIYRLFSEDRTVHRQTQELLFNSISRYHAVALGRIVAPWSHDELSGLLAEFSPWMVPFVYAGCPIDRRFPKAYRAYLASHTKSCHPILPFLYFLIQLAASSEVAACLLLELNVVKMLKMLCIHDFPNPAVSVISTTLRMDRIASSDVYASLILLFAALSSHPKSCARMIRGRDPRRRHSSCENTLFWFLSVYYTPDFLGLPNEMLLQSTWRDLEKSAMKLVLVALEHVLKGGNVRDDVDFLPLKEIYRDLIGVLSDPSSEPDMLYSAADSLLTCVGFGGDFRKILDDVLGERRLEDTIAMVKAIFKSLAPDYYPFPHNKARLRSRDVHRYLTGLAHAYSFEFRMFSPLVGELLGLSSCDATYTFPMHGRYSPLIFRQSSIQVDDYE
ncbi:hypothetical protein NM688_g4746 [Phlebia brevispora]|uniref:Uncharacterized protein n=1 Tax=Phlebia brevispora TaxID=194682 RepID=A0ACC1T292_9APHY|nr:hypothetical protein NM688_g4746 [Phlebia brevispora]